MSEESDRDRETYRMMVSIIVTAVKSEKMDVGVRADVMKEAFGFLLDYREQRTLNFIAKHYVEMGDDMRFRHFLLSGLEAYDKQLTKGAERLLLLVNLMDGAKSTNSDKGGV